MHTDRKTENTFTLSHLENPLTTTAISPDYGTHVFGQFAGLNPSSSTDYTTIYVRLSDHPRYGVIELSARKDSEVVAAFAKLEPGTEISVRVATPYLATSKRTGGKYLGGFYPQSVEVLAD